MMITKLIRAFLIGQIIFLPVLAKADPTTKPADVPKITFLKQGDKAPFSGALLNDLAQAQIIAEKNAAAKGCELEINYLKMRKDAECDLKVANLKSEIDLNQKRFDTILKIKDEETQKTRDLLLKTEKSDTRIWWMLGGIGIGIASTIGLFILATQVKKVGQ